jgi:Leucine-rich repeat (LRR) protein
LFKTPETFDALTCLGAHLEKLDISKNALAGEIPASAGALVALQNLKASQNQLTAIHPEAAAGWGKMTTLNINRNGNESRVVLLSKKLEPSIFCSPLMSLHIHPVVLFLSLSVVALLSIPVTAGAWTGLKSLDLRCNSLTALEDDACSTWTNVEVVRLGMNKLASLPAVGVGAWVSLRSLYVTDNKISELPLALANCVNLAILHSGVNVLKDLPPELFGSGVFKDMKDLELYRNKIASFPEDFGTDMPMLEQLSLSGNAIKAVPAGLGKCTSLRELHCANNAKLSKLPEDLGQLKTLAYVNFAGCQAIKALPAAFAAAWPLLREIDIRSGAKKEKCKLSAEWVDAAATRGFLLRGGIPPKKGKGKKK